MAFSEDEIQKYLELVAKMNPEAAKFNTFLENANRLSKESLAYRVKEQKSWVDQKNAIDKFTKDMKLLSGDTLGKFSKGLKQGFADLNSFREDLKHLDDTIETLDDDFEKHHMEIQRETMARRMAAIAMQGAALDFSKTVGKIVVGGIASSAGQFVKGLQNNASATEVSSGLMSGAIDMVAGSASAAGKGIEKVGEATSSLAKPGSKLQVLGVAAGLAGSALSALSEGAGKLAKFGVEVLSKEVEKTVTAYNNMSKAGAMFADGMTGMRNSASAAGLTVDQYSKVVTENASTLAKSGMGVGEATAKMGDVSSEMSKTVGTSGKTLRKELLQLGYSFEEQAGLTAEVMGDLRRSRSSMMGDDKAIAQQTAEYAGSLRTIAAITGEDAKRKMEEQRQASTQVAFRLKLQELEQKQPGITTKLQQAMLTMDETSKKALMEQMTIGAIVDKGANVMMAGSEAYADKINGMARLAESGAFTTEEAQKIQAEANDKMQGDLKNFREIGVAGMAGGLQDLNSAISGQIANMDKVTVAAVESSQKLVEAQKASTDKLTDQTMAAAEAAQQLKTQLQDVLTPAIAQFAKVSADMLGAVQKQLAELGLSGTGAPAGPSTWDKIKGAAGGAMERGMQGATVGGLAGSVALPGIGTVSGGAVGGIVGGIGGAIEGWFNAKEGKAFGGISEGPSTGYIEKLHGTEAVIPLDSNRSIPVNIDVASLASSITDALSGAQAASKALPSAIGAVTGSALGSMGGPTGPDMVQEQVALLREIREILSSSHSVQEQFVMNTYQ